MNLEHNHNNLKESEILAESEILFTKKYIKNAERKKLKKLNFKQTFKLNDLIFLNLIGYSLTLNLQFI